MPFIELLWLLDEELHILLPMPQSRLTQFFGAVRDGLGDAPAVCPGYHDGSSDDDVPMVIERRATGASAGFARSSDGRVLVTAKRSRYEDEAEECSDVEFVSSESDSFVVDDADHESNDEKTDEEEVVENDNEQSVEDEDDEDAASDVEYEDGDDVALSGRRRTAVAKACAALRNRRRFKASQNTCRLCADMRVVLSHLLGLK